MPLADTGFYCTLQNIPSNKHKRHIRGSNGRGHNHHPERSYPTGTGGALRTAADREHRSVANMIEVLIQDYCGRNGVKIPKQRALLSGK